MEVYEKILSANPAMPTFFSKNLSDLVKKLLRGQQAKRLGNIRCAGCSLFILSSFARLLFATFPFLFRAFHSHPPPPLSPLSS